MFLLINYRFIDDGEYQDEQEDEESDDGEEDEEETEDDEEVVITGVSNLSQSNFETSLDNSILLNSSASDDDPIAFFCNDKSPTFKQFEQIKDENKLKAFKEFLSHAPEEDYLTHLVFTILKLSSISEESQDAQQLSLDLFREAFEYAKTKDRVSSLKLIS